MAHPQNSPRGLFSKAAVSIAGSDLTASSITFNSTGAKLAAGLYLSNKTSKILTANSTGFISSGSVSVSGQATVGKLSANSTALLVPVTGFQFGALTTLKVTSNSTGIKIGARYISTNTTGNATT